MKRIIFVFIIIASFNLVVAQEAKISLEHVGYGKTEREVYFTVHNVGSMSITDVEIYVDGEKFKTIQSNTGPGMGFEFKLFLQPGEHIIEAETPEGAYDSFNTTVVEIRKRPIIQGDEELASLEKGIPLGIRILIASGIFFVIVVIVYFLLRRPRLSV